MMVIRPIAASDLKPLLALAKQSGLGITTLPADKGILTEKIQLSMESFAKQVVSPANEYYLFVMEDVSYQKIVGCCALKAAVGQVWPFYSYKLSRLSQKNQELHIDKEIQLLNLVNDYQGATELCSLLLAPDARVKNNGKYLSLSRFLFMGQQPTRFADNVMAEIRGYVDDEGHSPFWRAVGKHFFGIDFPRADHLSGIGKKQFIADLMPQYPVYVNLLPEAAQAVIGQAHAQSRAAKAFLEKQNLQYTGYVDIFDAGPCVEAPMEKVRAIKNQKCVRIVEVKPSQSLQHYLVATTGEQFRCAGGHIDEYPDGTVALPQDLLTTLQVDKGDIVTILQV